MAVSSLTLNYDAILASTLFNLHQAGAITDAISTSNRVFFELIRSKQYTGDASGNRMQVNLLYGHGYNLMYLILGLMVLVDL